MPNHPKDEGFLNRWSRVKTEGEPAVAETETEVEAGQEISESTAEDELTDAELLEKLGLPDPTTLKAGDDFSGFMSSQVPEHLRKVALRLLWRSNPLLANVDGLVDYGEDFTDAATVIENMQTIYQVGKGSAWKYKAEQEALAAAELEAENSPEADAEILQRTLAETPTEPEQSEQSEQEDSLQSGIEDKVNQFTEEQNYDDAELIAATTPRPRPMRFEFD